MNLEVNTSPADTGIRAAHREALITAELATRASRRPNHGAEAKVLRRLAHALATPDAAMLDMLTLEAARLCRAGSAGISVLESPPDRYARPAFVAAATVTLFAYACWVDATAPHGVSPLHRFMWADYLSGQTQWLLLPAQFSVVPACLLWPAVEYVRLSREHVMSPKTARA
ncbi:hypothetical protein LJR267_010424 [Paraburkholderia hospita]|jgi:hypothetical protein|uniref:hypothetical protein n=1 Tax=Paraburkholderia hospita TaxID=169430 RepID=UPI003ECE7C37